MLYVNEAAGYNECAYCIYLPCPCVQSPFSHQTSLTKHKLKDKMIQNFRTVTAEHRPHLVPSESWPLCDCIDPAVKANPTFIWKYVGSRCWILEFWPKVIVGNVDLGIISTYVLSVLGQRHDEPTCGKCADGENDSEKNLRHCDHIKGDEQAESTRKQWPVNQKQNTNPKNNPKTLVSAEGHCCLHCSH